MEPSRVPGSCGTILSHENPGGGTLPLQGSGSDNRETLQRGGTLQRRPAIRKKDYVRSRIKVLSKLIEDSESNNREWINYNTKQEDEGKGFKDF
ncbi:Hypothetical predicted protein [Octopus vulgaris]|uniref:Uncharacterized protein n=1 Tax=Octopus vulgaris TaxID=6645 RepID=A0AA36F319_OCTVU|nr:Hypothetical predicted protein [Octopus vulgaris]